MNQQTNPLGDALAGEHAAIYAYGSVGVLLDDDRAELARRVEHEHRQRRDELIVLLDERGTPAPPAAAAYEFPFPITDEAAALALVVLIEERVAAVWRAALEQVVRDDRELALDALVRAAHWATRWRDAAGISPTTVAFPGDS